MTLKSRFLPWQPKLVFSGYSYYAIDIVYGKIVSQRDVWDAIKDQSTPSVSLYLCRRLLHACMYSIVLVQQNLREFALILFFQPCFACYADRRHCSRD